MKLLDDFIKKVKDNRPCDSWNNTDQLCNQINLALQKQFDTNQRAGWVRSDFVDTGTDLKKMNEETILQSKQKSEYEIMRRNSDIRLAYDFLDSMDDKILHTIKKQTYIDNFNREIILEIQGMELKVSITTRIEYLNIRQGVEYYSANPRFETYDQAKSYKHEEFTINRINYVDDIISNIEFENKGRQFPYIVKNELPLKYEDHVIILHKTSHLVPVNQFFHVYQLVFPCRSFLTTILLKNDVNEKFQIRTGTFSSYNVHTNKDYTSEFRKDDVNTITIGKWSLPGSGYTVVLQER